MKLKNILLGFFLLLMTIEEKIKKAEKPKPKSEEDRIIEAKYEELKKYRLPYQKSAPEPSLSGRIKSAFRNIGNVTVNAFDNTIGYPIAGYQTYKTDKYVEKNPNTKKEIVYLMHGVLQNQGSQWRYGRQLRKEGKLPRHLKGNHHLPIEEDAEKGFEQIDKFQKKTKLKNPHERYDIFSGHSSGANVGIYMSGDERIKKYGIRNKPMTDKKTGEVYIRSAVQARAPAPYGIEAHTWPQKLLMPIVEADDLSKKAGKKNAFKMARINPKVNIDIIAGRYDRLVPPRDAVYMPKHPRIKHYVIEHKDSTHFGTSGVNKDMNDIFIDLIKGKAKYEQKKYYKKAA